MESKDAEDFDYMTSAEFWQTIRDARRMPTVPLESLEKELFANKSED